MYQIEGLTEEEILKVINSIVNQIAPAYVFGYYTLEDIKQEGRLYGLEALPRFIAERSFGSQERNSLSDKLYNFLRTHITHRYCNLLRDNFERTEPPNCKCRHCRDGTPEKCKRYQKFVQRNNAKKSIASAAQEPPREIEDSVPSFTVESRELVELLNKHLPPYLRADFRRMLEQIKVPSRRKEKIKEILTTVIRSGLYDEAYKI